ncbi:MAG: type II secretion system GspH family protein [Peptococcaceae bacterium]|nr:type II secretion system GspH family protein [Peptococcaceae bacterium]
MFGKLTRRLGKSFRNQKGFTLTELLVVVSVVAILAGVLIPKMLPHTQNARVSQSMNDLATMRSIIEAYATTNGQGRYPKAGTPGTPSGTPAPDADISVVLQAGGVRWTGTNAGITDSWGNAFTYTPYLDSNNNVIGWSITSNGPDKKSGTTDDLFVSSSYPPTQGTVPSNVSDGTASTTTEKSKV